jgi:membrane protease YdiL (CAAX protease family)
MMKRIFGEKLVFDWKIVLLTVVSTLLLMIEYYHYPLFQWTKVFPFWERTGISVKVLDGTFLYFVLPMLIILFIFRQSPRQFGFGLGDWKAGIVITVAGIVLSAPILYYLGHENQAIQAYYKPLAPALPWNTFLDLFGWEFLFRGWLLFGYARKFGPEAIWLQAVPFALAHLGKPELETLSTIFGGFAFGWVAWRTKSFIYPFLIHWFVASFIILIAAGYLG